MKAITILLVLTCFHAQAQDQWKNVYVESAWSDRDRWQKAPELIAGLNITAGSRVADIGCHEGYLTVKLATAVGEQGTVYAVDVDPTRLARLKTILEDRKLMNVVAVKGDPDDPRLPANSLDAVVILDAYHEMTQHDKMLSHILMSLKPKGRLILCEPIAEERRRSPRSVQTGKHELGMGFALDDLKRAGFKIVRQQDPWVDRTDEKGDKMWIIIAMKR